MLYLEQKGTGQHLSSRSTVRSSTDAREASRGDSVSEIANVAFAMAANSFGSGAGVMCIGEPWTRATGVARMWTDEDAEAAKPVVGNESVKTLRDRDNTRCVGGLRAPWRAVQKINNLRSAGRRVRAVIEKFIDDNDGVLGLWDRLGRAATEGTVEVLLDELRRRLGLLLQADSIAKAHPHCSWRVGIVEGFNRLSGDPEILLPLRLREGAPIGVRNRRPACRIFRGSIVYLWPRRS